MKLLVIGSGGREHAIIESLYRSDPTRELYALPGNPGMATKATCIEGACDDIAFIVSCIQEHAIDLTIVGPEVPLCLGLVDAIEEAGFLAFGPSAKAATLEGSKSFAKEFMERYHIPTARYQKATSYKQAIASLSSFTYPVVIKADGLAAGKGVIIAFDEAEAKQTLHDFMVDGSMSGVGHTVIIEEYLTGKECSLLCFTDGKTIVPMVSVKDHKAIYEGDTGPNTGGMGTVSPNPFVTKEMEQSWQTTILEPFIKGLQAEDMRYHGVIFIGLMIGEDKTKVLEFNVRFGDPETQSILLRLETDLVEIMEACIEERLGDLTLQWKDTYSGTLVLASQGYPGTYPVGKVITVPTTNLTHTMVLHAGTKEEGNCLVTNGGRVLNICATGCSIDEVRDKLYTMAQRIYFDGKIYRKDIGI